MNLYHLMKPKFQLRSFGIFLYWKIAFHILALQRFLKHFELQHCVIAPNLEQQMFYLSQ